MIACIPSKGRPKTKAWELFGEAGIQSHHFVEPQDVAVYEEAGVPNIVDIGANGRGVSFVRTFILDWATEREEEAIVMSDDDVTGFVRYEPDTGKTVKVDASIWLEIDQKMQRLPFEMAGINHAHHCWHEAKPVSVNCKWVEGCVYFKPTEMHWRYDQRLNMKEDRDMVMQTIEKGAGLARWNHLGLTSATLGANEGGLLDDYKAGRDEDGAKAFVQKWAQYATIWDRPQGQDFKKATGRDSRLELKVNLKDFAKAMGKTVR